jgi:hypothetical protein
MPLRYSQKTNFSMTVGEQSKIENEIRSIVGQQSTSLMLTYYIIFGKQVVKLIKKFSGKTLIGELAILDNLWQGRGLDGQLLEEIKHHYMKSYPYGKIFILDESYLDGEDVLA